MAFALLDATTWVRDHDFTTSLNQIQLQVEADEVECNTFGGNGYKSRIAGLKNVQAEVEGYWDSAPDKNIFDNLGIADQVVTMSSEDAETTVSYAFQAGRFSYQTFGGIGEAMPFTLSMMGTNTVGAARGQVAKAKGNVSAAAAIGSPVNLGAGSAGKFLVATLHVFSAATTVTVQVQSAPTSAFTTPTLVGTVNGGAITTANGYWFRTDASAITDTWYRFNVSAITGTFSLAGAIAIQ